MRLVRVQRLTMVWAVAGALLAGAAGCIETPASPTKTPAFSQTDLKQGTGDPTVAGSILTVNYTGWLYDPSKADFKGAQFDSSLGAEPFTFVLGTGSVIAGWDQGLVGMKAGGVRRLVIPPSLAYGSVRVSAIPPNAALIFDVELISFE